MLNRRSFLSSSFASSLAVGAGLAWRGNLWAQLESLPTNQREVIRLKFQNGFSYQEISRISGHSVSNVGYLIHAGMKTLRGLLFDGQPIEVHS